MPTLPVMRGELAAGHHLSHTATPIRISARRAIRQRFVQRVLRVFDQRQCEARDHFCAIPAAR